MMRSPASTGLSRQKLAIAMVGLPARGKTYLARKLSRYLSWSGQSPAVFNVGQYRRARLGPGQRASFFDPADSEGSAARALVAEEALEDACAWLRGEGTVAIYDATNTTRERRASIANRFEGEGHQVIFVESICNDQAIVEANVRATKLESPDYEGEDPDDAVRDFRQRLSLYERAYEPIDEDALRYIKIIDLGRDVVLHRIEGYLPSRLVYFLLNVHAQPRTIFLTRHGQSTLNLHHRIGGDASITRLGAQYAERLRVFYDEQVRVHGEIAVWTSTLRRTIETARELPTAKVAWRALDEIDAGVCDGMTYDEVRVSMASEAEARARDKFRYRYPRGESYQDLIERLEPVILELERVRTPLIVVSHQAVARVLYGYLMELAPETSPFHDIPLHTVLELQSGPTATSEKRHALGPRVDVPHKFMASP
jgi:broad specificity phosphatase PhoE/predicted kinase